MCLEYWPANGAWHNPCPFIRMVYCAAHAMRATVRRGDMGVHAVLRRLGWIMLWEHRTGALARHRKVR